MKKYFTIVAIALLTLWAGKCKAQTIFNLTWHHPLDAGQATVLIDFNNDGLLDFVTANKQSLGFALNMGNGLFQDFDTAVVANANGFGSYDLNSDWILDFSVAHSMGDLANDLYNDIWICNGNSTFTIVNSGNESLGAPRSVIYTDFDNDGYVDSYHSASAFLGLRQGNQIHKGLPNGLFGPDIAETIMPGYFYDSLVHPTLGPQYWSNRQWKGNIARDLDGDGFADIINVAYMDYDYQPDTFTLEWVYQQSRGAYILRNNSTTGNIGFSDVSLSALGADANGADSSFWSVYAPIPIDYDNDGDYDLILGGLMVRSIFSNQPVNTDIIRFYENVSTPGNILFIEKTLAVGLEFINQLTVNAKKGISFAAGIPFDYNNDGFMDFAFANRKSASATPIKYVLLFINNGDSTFSEVPFSQHGIGGLAGGRDINVGDLNNDGKLDIIVSDGTVGGYTGTDSTLVYINSINNTNKWVQLNIMTSPSDTWAFDHTVKVYAHGTTQLLGMDDVRTDFSYRSKRYPILHFGLGSIDSIDVVISHNGTIYQVDGLPSEQLHIIYLNEITGLNDKEKEIKFEVYPNPANTMLFINSDMNCSLHYQITNFLGQIIIQATTNRNSIDVSSLNNGIYFVQIKGENGEISTRKFAKQ